MRNFKDYFSDFLSVSHIISGLKMKEHSLHYRLSIVNDV